jgi:hypothetical protein
MVDAWTVLFGDALVTIFAERPARLARHRRDLKRSALATASVVRRLRGEQPDASVIPPHRIVASDIPGSYFPMAALVTMLMFPSMGIGGLALLMSSSGKLDITWSTLAGWSLVTIALRIANAARVVHLARRDSADLFELLPQGPAFAWALVGASTAICALILWLPKHELNRLPEVVIAITFLAGYLFSALLIGASRLRRNAREDVELAGFVAQPLEEDLKALHQAQDAARVKGDGGD